MKTKPQMDPAAAFPDATHPPGDAELPAALGRAARPVETLLANLRAIRPGLTQEWRFSERSGWHRICFLKKRRLFYLVPQRGDFRLSLILGGKAIASLRPGPFGGKVAALLKSAKRYPEGTAFLFDRQTFELELVAALLAAKIAH